MIGMRLSKRAVFTISCMAIAFIACSDNYSVNDDGGTVPGYTPEVECNKYLSCLSKAEPSNFAADLKVYDADSACWKTPAATKSCKDACISGYKKLAANYPGVPACGGSANAICRLTCRTSSDCPSHLVCDTKVSKCVTCVKNDDCKNSGYYLKECNLKTNTCIECKDNSDCGSTGFRGCNAVTGKCKTCSTDADCSKYSYSTDKCREDRCMGCSTDADCQSLKIYGNKCSPTRKVCVEHRFSRCSFGIKLLGFSSQKKQLGDRFRAVF